MKLLQITGSAGGDTILIPVPDCYTANEIAELLEGIKPEREVVFKGQPVKEIEIDLPEELEIDYFSVFVLIA